MSPALKLLQGPALGDLKVQAAKDPCPISMEEEIQGARQESREQRWKYPN